MRANPVTVGLIGAGRIGRIHGENLARRVPGARLAAIADVNAVAARELGERLGVPVVSDDYRTVLAATDVHAVAICSSSDTHARLIEEAAGHGKHIFCEKPIDLEIGPIERALEAARRARVVLQVGFNRRFDPGFARARQLVAAGTLGDVHLVRITSRDPAPPPLAYVRVSGGIFLDMAIHDFDMVRFLTGTEVVEVFAAGEALVDPDLAQLGDVDTCVTMLRLARGGLATIDNSRRAVYGYDQRAEVFGTNGMVAVGNRMLDTHQLFDAAGAHGARPQTFFIDRYADALLAEMAAFVESVALDRPPPVSGADGLQATRIAHAARESLRTQRPVPVAAPR